MNSVMQGHVFDVKTVVYTEPAGGTHRDVSQTNAGKLFYRITNRITFYFVRLIIILAEARAQKFTEKITCIIFILKQA